MGGDIVTDRVFAAVVLAQVEDQAGTAPDGWKLFSLVNRLMKYPYPSD